MAKKKKLVIMKSNGMMDKKEDRRFKNGNLIKIKQPAKPMPKKKNPPMRIMPVFGSSY